jgi:hypothetical protein
VDRIAATIIWRRCLHAVQRCRVTITVIDQPAVVTEGDIMARPGGNHVTTEAAEQDVVVGAARYVVSTAQFRVNGRDLCENPAIQHELTVIAEHDVSARCTAQGLGIRITRAIVIAATDNPVSTVLAKDRIVRVIHSSY